jgi:predicted transcriptional regulator
MKKRKFSLVDQKIMRTLYQTKIPMTAYTAGKKVGVTFPTAKKSLNNLSQRGIVRPLTRKKPVNYAFNFSIFQKKKRK